MKAKRCFFLGLLIIIGSNLHTPLASAADSWKSTGSMLHPRADFTATLLQSGQVLIVGYNWQKQAELYDPPSETFVATGSTLYSHANGATATLLNSGKVLVVGGMSAQQSAELYHPDAGVFEDAPGINAVHTFHTATLLADGRVLIVGGQDENGPQTHAVCEIYDPQTGAFSLTDSLNVDRSGHTATLLPDGTVLIVGGFQTTTPGNGMNVSSCEIYDPANGTFALVPELSQPRSGHQAALLNNGKALISGGSWTWRSGELYDFATNTWSLTGDIVATRRSYHTATLLQNGRVLLAGGYIDAATSSAEFYDPLTNSFFADENMISARTQHAAVRLQNGNVLVAGGFNADNEAMALAEICIIDTTAVVGVSDNMTSGAPSFFQLMQNYPNPFNPVTTIRFQLSHPSHVELFIYALDGRKVKSLISRQYNSGVHAIEWNGLDESGQLVSSGVFQYVLQVDGFRDSKKMVFLK